jgi:hypothetical protein
VTPYEKVKAVLLTVLTVAVLVFGTFLVIDANAVAQSARELGTTTHFINSYIPLIKAEISIASNGVF